MEMVVMVFSADHHLILCSYIAEYQPQCWLLWDIVHHHLHLDAEPLFAAPWTRFYSQFFIHLIIFPSSWCLHHLDMRILWGPTSEALLKSK